MRIKFSLNLQALRHLRKELLLLLASCTAEASVMLAMCCSVEAPGEFEKGNTSFLVVLPSHQLEVAFLNDRYMESVSITSNTNISTVIIKVVSPVDFLKFLTKDFKENDKSLTFEIKRRGPDYSLEWSVEISGSVVSGKFLVNFQPEQAQTIITNEDFEEESKSILNGLPNLVKALEVLHSERVDMDMFIDLNKESVSNSINFKGEISKSYKLRFVQNISDFTITRDDYAFQTRIPWQLLGILMQFMKEFRQTQLLVDTKRRLLFHAQDQNQESSKFMRLYLQADLRIKEEEQEMRVEESNRHESASQ